MPDSVQAGAPPTAGLETFVLLRRFHGIAVDAAQIRHRFGGADIGVSEMLRCAKEFELKARAITSHWSRLAKTSLPAIAQRRDGGFFILGTLTPTGALIQDAAIGRPQELSRAEFEAQWNGRLVLIARRASLGSLVRRFDITWFQRGGRPSP